MATYIENAVSPFLYGTGNSVDGIQGFVPSYGVQDVPISLNNTFLVELGNVYVPQLPPNLRNINNAWKVTFLPPGSSVAKKQIIVSDGFGNKTIPQGYAFFNTVIESGSDVITDGVFEITVAGYMSGVNKQFYPTQKPMLLSTRGQFIVEAATFPWTKPNNPSPGDNYNGVQRGSKITFFTNDSYSVFVFEEPQSIRGYLNTLPEF